MTREGERRVDCSIESDGPLVTVRPVGELDALTAPAVHATLLTCLTDQPVAVLIDLAGLRASDGSLVTVLSTVAREAAAWPGCPLVLFGADPATAAPLRDIAAGGQVTVCRGQADAVALARQTEPPTPLRDTLAPVLTSIPVARTFASEACRDWRVPERPAQAVELVVGELVANAVQHARTVAELILRPAATRAVRPGPRPATAPPADQAPRYVHVAIRDGDRRPARLTGPEWAGAASGRGLQVVDAFAVGWGSIPIRDGKVTWATIRCA